MPGTGVGLGASGVESPELGSKRDSLKGEMSGKCCSLARTLRELFSDGSNVQGIALSKAGRWDQA